MPVVIDEVVITVEVDNRQSGGASSPPAALEGRQELIEECVEKVLEILEQRDER
jgi:hypothetical protein